MKTVRLLIALLIGVSVAGISPVQAAKGSTASHFVPYPVESGTYNGRAAGVYLAFKGKISLTGASWLRLYFGSASLGSKSYILVTSPTDSTFERLTSSTLRQSDNSTIQFQGDAVEVELFVAPGDFNVSFTLSNVMVGGQSEKDIVEDFCGSPDTRVPYFSRAVGRLRNIKNSDEATAWIAPNGDLVTAGHVIAGWIENDDISDWVLEFNVPDSKSDGTMVPSSAKDQYTLTGWHEQANTPNSSNQDIGNDWGVFTVNPNPQTGLLPIQEQQAYINVEQNDNASQLEVIGYGTASGSLNNTQQQSQGPNDGSSGSLLEYQIYTAEGESGGPVIDLSTGDAVGINTYAGCSIGYQANFGTSMYDAGLWSYLQPTSHSATVTQLLSDNTTTDPNLWQWNGNSFTSLAPGAKIPVTPGDPVVLKGDQVLDNGQKYDDWTVNGVLDYDVINPHKFYYLGSKMTSHLQPVYNATLESFLTDVSSTGFPVSFKDPWLIDYNDPTYGMSNRGMSSAPYESVPIASNNLGTGSSHQGVFVDENQTFSPYRPVYSVAAPATQSYNGHTWAFLNWSGTDGTYFQNATADTTPVVFGGDGSTVSANYKGIQLSTDPTAFSNNGQRRLIETTSGGETWLTEVYTDGGHVWMEHSSDGGSTWILGNNGQPLDGTAGGKDPSIAFTNNAGALTAYNYIGVVWEEPSGSTYAIMGKIFNQYMGSPTVPEPYVTVQTLFTEPSGGDGYSVNADPNLTLAGGSFGSYFLTFDQKSASVGINPGVHWRVGDIQQSGLGGWDGAFGTAADSGLVSGTDANTTDFQMSPYPGYNSNSDVWVNYIYREGSPAGTIYSGNLVVYYETYTDSWYTIPTNFGMISYDAAINLSPSIVSLSNYDGYAACWLEYNTLVFWNQNQSVRNYYGTDDAQSCSINIGGTDTSSSGFVAWSTENNGTWANHSMQFVDGSPNSSTMQTLNTSGEYVEVGNGASTSSDLSDMYVASFYPFTSPYTFKTSGTLAPLSKASPQLAKGPGFTTASEGAGPQLVKGRGFMIKKGDVSFTYRFGDLNVDGKNIGFVNAPDTADYGNLNVLNGALETQPFQVSNGSQIVFTEHSGFPDSAAAVNALGRRDYIDYKVEVVDSATGDVLGMIAKNSVTSSNIHPLRTNSYRLNTAGLAGKTLRVKIVVSTNLPAYTAGATLSVNDSLPAPIKAEIARLKAPHSNIFLIKSFARQNQALAQVASNDLSTLNLQVPKTFSLSQNYPNPFNPTTVIDYTLPKAEHVTLTIYDVLGQEVETLVNEDQNVGRYSVTFNGSRLASGVYFYRLVAGSHVVTKKMLELK